MENDKDKNTDFWHENPYDEAGQNPLVHGSMIPKEPVGLPVVTESGKVPEVHPYQSLIGVDIGKLYHALMDGLLDGTLAVDENNLITREQVDEIAEKLKKSKGIGRGLTEPILFPNNNNLIIDSGREWHEKLSELRSFIKDENFFTIDSIPSEGGGEKMFNDSEITPKHIGGEDSVEEILKSTGIERIDELTDKFLSLPTLDEMMARNEKIGGFRRGVMFLYVAKPRALPPKTNYRFESNPFGKGLDIADFHMNQRPDHKWDPIIFEDIDFLGTYPFVKNPIEVKIAEDFDKKRE